MALAYLEYYTFDDYRLWHGDWELIVGMPYAMTPSPGVTHQAVSVNIVSQIKAEVDNNNKHCNACYVLMETDWQISNDTIVRPDIMLVCKELDERVLVTPDLIVEVVSVSSTRRDELIKFDLYQREGVLVYILVYPQERRAKIYSNTNNGFKKMADYSSQKIDLLVAQCPITIDFSSIWR